MKMKGWYEKYSYCGIMPDGSKRRFATEQEYREAYAEEAAPLILVREMLSRNKNRSHNGK